MWKAAVEDDPSEYLVGQLEHVGHSDYRGRGDLRKAIPQLGLGKESPLLWYSRHLGQAKSQYMSIPPARILDCSLLNGRIEMGSYSPWYVNY